MSTPVHSPAAASSLIVSTGPCSLSQLVVDNAGGAQFIQLHDSATVPADGAIPTLVFRIPASTSAAFDAALRGVQFNTGLVICNSSTAATKTIGAANCYFTAILD